MKFDKYRICTQILVTYVLCYWQYRILFINARSENESFTIF